MTSGPQPRDYNIGMPEFYKDMASDPLNRGRYRARVISIQQFGSAAVVVLAEDGCWTDVSFVDILSLWKSNGAWKIVNKTFAHTGGTPPG
jgi:hypothetical protein